MNNPISDPGLNEAEAKALLGGVACPALPGAKAKLRAALSAPQEEGEWLEEAVDAALRVSDLPIAQAELREHLRESVEAAAPIIQRAGFADPSRNEPACPMYPACTEEGCGSCLPERLHRCLVERRGRSWRAECSCGWRGGERRHPMFAERDADQHLDSVTCTCVSEKSAPDPDPDCSVHSGLSQQSEGEGISSGVEALTEKWQEAERPCAVACEERDAVEADLRKARAERDRQWLDALESAGLVSGEEVEPQPAEVAAAIAASTQQSVPEHSGVEKAVEELAKLEFETFQPHRWDTPGCPEPVKELYRQNARKHLAAIQTRREIVAREGSTKKREWDISPNPDGESFFDKEGNEVLGWHPRHEDQDVDALLAEFGAWHAYVGAFVPLRLRPVLMRDASEVECKIEGWEEGTMVRCTTRAKNPQPYWQIEIAASTPQPADQQEVDRG